MTGKDAAGKPTNASIVFVNDIVAPAGGSIAYTNGVVSADTAITKGNCCRYHYVVSDKVGNVITHGSDSIARF